MKRKMTSIFATTGISIIVLGCIGLLSGAHWVAIGSVFQTLGANLVIHVGLHWIKKIETPYLFIETLMDIGYSFIVLVVFGYFFNWYSSTPIWILGIMAVVVYLIGLFLNNFRVREDIKQINELLQQRNNTDLI